MTTETIKRNEVIFFTKDGQHWREGKFIADCGQKDAVKIMLDDGEWTVLKNQVCTWAEQQKRKAEFFYAEHRAVIDGAVTAKSKAQLARDLNEDYGKVLRILARAKVLGVVVEGAK